MPYSLTEKMDRLLHENGSKFHFVSGYGLTECVTVCSFTDPRREAPQGCIGVPTYNIEVMTVKPGTTEEVKGEDGELCVYPHLNAGLLPRPGGDRKSAGGAPGRQGLAAHRRYVLH